MLLVLLLTGQAEAAADLEAAAASMETGITNALKMIGADMYRAAADMAQIDSGRELEIRKLLRECHIGRSYVIDAAFIDDKGVMKLIEPDPYRKHEGADISRQEAIVKMRKEKQPRMGSLFLSVEGIRAVDIEFPVFTEKKGLRGSLSLLVRPEELLRAMAAPVEGASRVNCWVMQRDGLILYETDPTQIGRNLFTDPLYQAYPALIALGRQTVEKREGKGFYSFLLHGSQQIVRKHAAWRTVRFFGKDWIVVVYREMAP